MRVVCASAKEETFFVAVENGPVKAIRLLKCLNKKKVKVTAGKAPKGEGKAGVQSAEVRAAGFLAKWRLGPDFLAGLCQPLGKVYLFSPLSCWI